MLNVLYSLVDKSNINKQVSSFVIAIYPHTYKFIITCTYTHNTPHKHENVHIYSLVCTTKMHAHAHTHTHTHMVVGGLLCLSLIHI